MNREEILAMEAGDNLDVEVWDEIFNQVGHILKYSTDISAAWQVVEKMIAEGFMLSLQGWNTKLKGWECNIFKTVPANYPVRNVLTAPEAICKAALLAKLEK